MKASLKYIPKYDPEFKPAILEIQKFNEEVSKSPDKTELIIILWLKEFVKYYYG